MGKKEVDNILKHMFLKGPIDFLKNHERYRDIQPLLPTYSALYQSNTRTTFPVVLPV